MSDFACTYYVSVVRGIRKSTFVGGALAAIALSLTLLQPPSVTGATKVDPLTVLNSLPVQNERSSGYDRGLFRHWSDLDRNGCDTREEVLIAERVKGSVQGCKVLGGLWVSKYDGVRTSNSSDFDIDHFVPLKEAWDSGAWRWDSVTRERFANDLGYAPALIAVSASSNRSKSDQDPTDWMPRRNQCSYAKNWVGVKFRWRLSVDSTEKRVLTKILSNCKGSITLPPRA